MGNVKNKHPKFQRKTINPTTAETRLCFWFKQQTSLSLKLYTGSFTTELVQTLYSNQNFMLMHTPILSSANRLCFVLLKI